MSDNRFEKIDVKLDKLQDKLASIDATLAAQHESLKLHIKRTNLLEQKLEPVEKHVAMVDGVFKFLGLTSVILALIEGFLKIKNG